VKFPSAFPELGWLHSDLDDGAAHPFRFFGWMLAITPSEVHVGPAEFLESLFHLALVWGRVLIN
jgi:hypothetical protein